MTMSPQEFRAIRKRLDMTQAEFAGLLGVGRQYLNLIEGGATNPSLTLLRLADAIDKGYRPTDLSR